MFSDTNTNNQQFQQPASEQTQPKFEMAPNRKKFSFSQVPVIAQISGLVSLLVIGAGLLTVNQLAQTSQNLQSQAATGDVQLEFDQPTATLAFGQEKSFFVVATPSNNTMKISAAIVRLRNEDEEIAAVTSMTPIVGVLPVVLKPFGAELTNAQITQHALTVGADPLKPFSGKKNLVEVKVKAKNTAGQAVIEIAQNSEIAAFDNAGNVMRIYDLNNAQKQFLTIDVKADDGGGGTDLGACIGKTAQKVAGATKTDLPANSKVKRDDIIEYSVSVGHAEGTQAATITDVLPAHLEYVNDSAVLKYLSTNGNIVTQDVTPTYRLSNNNLIYAINIHEDSAGEYVFTYQTRVKTTAALGNFTNAVAVAFNGDHQNPDKNCKITLAVEETPPSPPPPTTPAAKLTVKLQIQGVLTSGVTETGELALRYTNPQIPTEKVVKKYPITLTSGANGIFTSNKVELTDFPTTSVGSIEVFVKTPVTLRKKIGTTERTAFSSTTGELVMDKSQEVLFAGDFDRTQGQENFFRILDVSAMLSQYKTVSNPVTAANKEYDLDKNNIINILDVSIILSNYTKTSVAGEAL